MTLDDITLFKAVWNINHYIDCVFLVFKAGGNETIRCKPDCLGCNKHSECCSGYCNAYYRACGNCAGKWNQLAADATQIGSAAAENVTMSAIDDKKNKIKICKKLLWNS